MPQSVSSTSSRITCTLPSNPPPCKEIAETTQNKWQHTCGGSINLKSTTRNSQRHPTAIWQEMASAHPHTFEHCTAHRDNMCAHEHGLQRDVRCNKEPWTHKSMTGGLVNCTDSGSLRGGNQHIIKPNPCPNCTQCTRPETVPNARPKTSAHWRHAWRQRAGAEHSRSHHEQEQKARRRKTIADSGDCRHTGQNADNA